MSSTSSTASPDDASKNSTEATSEDATRPFPASGDTRPLTMPLPTSDGVATDVLSTEGTPGGADQIARTDDADAKSKAAAPTDVPASPAASSAQNQNGFSTAFDTDPFGREGKSGKGRVTSADSAPASSTPGPVWTRRDGGRSGPATSGTPGHQGVHGSCGGPSCSSWEGCSSRPAWGCASTSRRRPSPAWRAWVSCSSSQPSSPRVAAASSPDLTNCAARGRTLILIDRPSGVRTRGSRCVRGGVPCKKSSLEPRTSTTPTDNEGHRWLRQLFPYS